MMDEEILEQINQFRMTAETMGETALAAISKGDAGMARTAARQAAQYARLAVQLETGTIPKADSNRDGQDEQD